MIAAVVSSLLKLILALRYRVHVRGIERITQRGTRGILFLPNHPALIDPLIVMTYLHGRFAPRPLADADQIRRPFIRRLAAQVGTIAVPDIKVYGRTVQPEVEAARQTCVATLQAGGNLLLYPSGHLYRGRHEDLRGNSGAHDIVRACPAARIVLVRTRGLWGSSLSLAAGEYPNLARLFWPHIGRLLRNYLFFLPRRDVLIELHEPADLPRDADRNTFNRYLERFYNADAPPNTYVAYDFGVRPASRVLPEPRFDRAPGALARVPASTRQRVYDHLRAAAGVNTVADEDRLAQDLGLDSLARTELLLWLGQEFGATDQDGDALATVGDVLLAACGQAIVTRPTPLAPPPPAWFSGDPAARVTVPPGDKLTDVMLAAARAQPGRIILADQLAGARTYRDLITAILALRPLIARLAGTHVGIMLPASVAATIAYWATLFAGKVPVLVNWTTGARNMAHSLDLCGVKRVLTAGPLVQRLSSQGVELDALRDRLLPLEDLRRQLGRAGRVRAAARAWLSWRELERADVPDTAVVLVTSGSESLPKAVPLTHTNILTNIRDVLQVTDLRRSDRMLGFLPPFHSFGLTVTVVAPPVACLPVVYHTNPTEAAMLARLIAAYRATVLLGTPTFLAGILRATTDARQLASLRIIVTGAEKCPEHVYAALAARCPQATVLEGYGITECSPIVAVNRLEDPRPGTVGPVLPSVEHVLVDPETGAEVAPGTQGLLLVRGPSIFDGYLGADAASPFIEHAGRSWYRTGDLVSADADGVLNFRGRLKRFVKIGGEMVSLPAIEAALMPHYATERDEGPVLAVVATADETRPELVLFTTRPAERETVNRQLRAAGLSGLHNIGQVIQVDELPLLGNGKTDYRALTGRLSEA